MKYLRATIAGTIAVAALATATAAKFAEARGPRTLLGPKVKVGEGTARLFVEMDTKGVPQVIGITMSKGALTGLPVKMNTTSRCFDKDQSGHMNHGECIGDYQSTLTLPAAAAKLELPVTWATLNWNPEGHMAPAPPVWSAPHFDFHFYIEDKSVIEAIRPGPCGEFIDCDDFKTATKALPDSQHPADYINVGAAVPAMGNHLVDAKDPELADPSLGFSRTFIYGTWDGKVIFLEPMVSRAFLLKHPDGCRPVKAPHSWAKPGYYPSQYCVRYDEKSSSYRVTLEGLVYSNGK